MIKRNISYWSRGLEDEVELNNLKRNGDEPIGVSVLSRRHLGLDPLLLHVGVVIPGSYNSSAGGSQKHWKLNIQNSIQN